MSGRLLPQYNQPLRSKATFFFFFFVCERASHKMESQSLPALQPNMRTTERLAPVRATEGWCFLSIALLAQVYFLLDPRRRSSQSFLIEILPLSFELSHVGIVTQWDEQPPVCAWTTTLCARCARLRHMRQAVWLTLDASPLRLGNRNTDTRRLAYPIHCRWSCERPSGLATYCHVW